MISKNIIFPGEQKVAKNSCLKNVIPPPSTRLFEPGQDIQLKVSKVMTLMDLQQLLEDLMIFLEPLVLLSRQACFLSSTSKSNV